MHEIMMWEEDDMWVISLDDGPTTQGETKVEALLMLADAIREDDDDAQSMMIMAAETFILDPEQREFLENLEDMD